MSEPAIRTPEPHVRTAEPAIRSTEPEVRDTEFEVLHTEPAIRDVESEVRDTEPRVIFPRNLSWSWKPRPPMREYSASAPKTCAHISLSEGREEMHNLLFRR